VGDYPDATAVFDVDSIGLTNMVNRLNHGLDLGSNPIGKPTGYLIGVGVNPGAVNLEQELRRFEYKVEAGAEFAITQPVFDQQVLTEFLKKIEHCRIPVLAGIWPLVSYRNAQFMNNEVPGASVPDEIMTRMRSTETKEAGIAEGLAVAQEAVNAVKGMVQGVQVAAPFGRYSLALQVLEAI
jgi:homocysteine S-methyltransferase